MAETQRKEPQKNIYMPHNRLWQQNYISNLAEIMTKFKTERKQLSAFQRQIKDLNLLKFIANPK